MSRAHPHLPSFPTRRSSDLLALVPAVDAVARDVREEQAIALAPPDWPLAPNEAFGEDFDLGFGIDDGIQGRLEAFDAADGADRKSTRLNSSHSQISYAVFCL